MEKLPFLSLRSRTLFIMFASASLLSAFADPTPVRHMQATIHGFLELRSEGGLVVGGGDITQVVHGDRVTSRTIFRFKDGSTDDEVTVFTQHGTLKLISDHRIQKGPSFPHPADMLVDARTGQITVRIAGKEGKEEVQTDHMDLPPDLANGLVPLVIENIESGKPPPRRSRWLSSPRSRVWSSLLSTP